MLDLQRCFIENRGPKRWGVWGLLDFVKHRNVSGVPLKCYFLTSLDFIKDRLKKEKTCVKNQNLRIILLFLFTM